jgi:hypothetical protein
MALFGRKKEVKQQKPDVSPEKAQLPALPQLPELPPLQPPAYPASYEPLEKAIYKPGRLPVLPPPSYPTSPTEKFTRSMIKSAVETPPEREEEEIKTQEIEGEEAAAMLPQITIPPQKRLRTQEYEEPEYAAEAIEEFEEAPVEEEMPMERPLARQARIAKIKEPVYIRLDKFEDALHTFEEIKQRIDEIQYLLHDIRAVRAKEESELEQWESELQTMKSQIDKIDADVFSRIQ